MSHKIERLDELGTFKIAEGPHWDVETQSLYFVDVFQHSIHRYKPSTKQHTTATLDKKISFFIPIEGRTNQFLAGMCNELNIITWDGVSSKIDNIEAFSKLNNNDTTLNDGKADSLGNLWTGSYATDLDLSTFTPARGCLYSLNCDKLKTHANNIGVSNGIAFCNHLKKLYFIDSHLQGVDQFDYNAETQAVENRETLFTLKKHGVEGWPDGLTIDADGNLWLAVFQDSKVIKIDATKPETLLNTIEMPEQQITSVAFGGKNLDELYVTTGGLKIPGAKDDRPLHGYLYKVTDLGTKGIPGCKVKI